MSHIDAFVTSPWSNHIYGAAGADLTRCRELLEDHVQWHNRANFLLEEGSVKVAKRVLGRQDYCWDSWCRNWVWERPVKVELLDGTVEPYRWRLYASKRGLKVEIEVKNEAIEDGVAEQVWWGFREVWDAGLRNNPKPGFWNGQPVGVIGRTNSSRGAYADTWDAFDVNGNEVVIPTSELSWRL